MPDVLDRAAAFLAGDGLAYARRQLRSRRLHPQLAEDVVGEVLLHAVRAVDAGKEIDNVEAWLTTVIRRRVVDVLRGTMRRPEALAPGGRSVDGDDVDPLDLVEADLADPDLAVVGRAVAADLRAVVARRLADADLAAAGALAVLAHRDPDDPAPAADDCPQPRAGATESEAASWVGLFYAGRRGWDGADAAARKRRSRWAEAQTTVLHDAAAEFGLHPGGDRAHR